MSNTFEKKTGNLSRWIGAHEAETPDGPAVRSVLVMEIVEVPADFIGDQPPPGAQVTRVVFRDSKALMEFVGDMLTGAKSVWPDAVFFERMRGGRGSGPVH